MPFSFYFFNVLALKPLNSNLFQAIQSSVSVPFKGREKIVVMPMVQQHLLYGRLHHSWGALYSLQAVETIFSCHVTKARYERTPDFEAGNPGTRLMTQTALLRV